MTNLLNISADIRIMLGADSGVTRDLLVQGLKKLGLKELTLCGQGSEAMKILEAGDLFDLVVCDRYLPDLNGLEVLREIQESEKILSGSFILVSAQIEGADVALAAELGCDAYLVKPFALKELAHKITQALKRMADASCHEARIRQAKNLVVKGNYKESLRAHQDLINADGETARLLVGKGRALRKMNASDEALACFDKAINLNKLYVHAYQEKGMCLLQAGETEAALAQLETAIKISPNNPIRYEIVADILYQCGHYGKAEDYLVRAIKLELSYPALYAQLGKGLSQNNLDISGIDCVVPFSVEIAT
jgi:DNA-binding response OmpR family regulator